MNNSFSTIKEFISLKDNCVFCNRRLKCVLASFELGPQLIPMINSSIVDDRFNFSFTHTSASWDLQAQCIIDVNTNLTTLEITSFSDSELNVDATNYLVAKTVLEGYSPHIEMYCPNKKCKMKYIFYSDMLKYDKVGDGIRLFKVRPFTVYMESFEVDKLWVQNDWINNSLNIYSKNHMDAPPVKHSTIDLSDMDKEKVITRIRTLVTFS